MDQSDTRLEHGWTRRLVQWWPGTALLIAGTVLEWAGWYGAAGETLVAKQLPFVLSASIPGAALLTAGALLLGGELTHRGSADVQAMVGSLFGLLTEEAPPEPSEAPNAGPPTGARDGMLVAVPAGTRFHRPDCVLVEGKTGVVPVGPREIEQRHLEACPVCRPPTFGPPAPTVVDAAPAVVDAASGPPGAAGTAAPGP
jgi:hypothetical protein